jgi:hypothetical protein
LRFPQERFHFLARLPNSFGQLLPNLVSSVFFRWKESPNWVIRVTQIMEWIFGWPEYLVFWFELNNQIFDCSCHLNNQIWWFSFFGFWKIGKLHSKPNSVNPCPCQSICLSLCR